MLSPHVPQFVSDTDGGFIYGCTDAFHLVYHHDTLAFRQLHIKKSNGLKLADQAAQTTALYLPIYIPSKFVLKISITSQMTCTGAQSCCSHICHVARGTSSKYKGNPFQRKFL